MKNQPSINKNLSDKQKLSSLFCNLVDCEGYSCSDCLFEGADNPTEEELEELRKLFDSVIPQLYVNIVKK